MKMRDTLTNGTIIGRRPFKSGLPVGDLGEYGDAAGGATTTVTPPRLVQRLTCFPCGFLMSPTAALFLAVHESEIVARRRVRSRLAFRPPAARR
ncbi:MAG: hypothetical protein M1457_08885 [bacterium]|nr:hypothetical protein [bacterium]